MQGASQVASIPEPIISSLAALTQGLFPVDAADNKVDYRGKIDANGKDEKVKPGDEASDPSKATPSRTASRSPPPPARASSPSPTASSRRSAKPNAWAPSCASATPTATATPTLTPRRRPRQGPRPQTHQGRPQGHNHEGHKATKATTKGHHQHPGHRHHARRHHADHRPCPSTPAGPLAPRRAAIPRSTTPRSNHRSHPSRCTRSGRGGHVGNPADTPRRIRFRARTPIEEPEAAAEPREAEKARLFAHPTRPESYAAGGEEQLNPEVAEVEIPAPPRTRSPSTSRSTTA